MTPEQQKGMQQIAENAEAMAKTFENLIDMNRLMMESLTRIAMGHVSDPRKDACDTLRGLVPYAIDGLGAKP